MTNPATALKDIAGTGARQATVPRELRELHRSVLRHFLDTGTPAGLDWLGERAVGLGLDPTAAIPALSEADLVHFVDGVVAVAYPFSGTPTPHVVRLSTGVEAYSMCSLDSLGIPPMAGLDAVIDSVDPISGEPVRVSFSGGAITWDPAGTVVLVARAGYCGPSHACSCPHMNFHTRREHGERYLREHPELAGMILSQEVSLMAARVVFGGLMVERTDESS